MDDVEDVEPEDGGLKGLLGGASEGLFPALDDGSLDVLNSDVGGIENVKDDCRSFMFSACKRPITSRKLSFSETAA